MIVLSLPYQSMDTTEALNKVLSALLGGSKLTRAAWPETVSVLPEDFGLEVDAQGTLFWPTLPQTLDAGDLHGAFPDLAVGYFPVVDSTNTRLVEVGARESITESDIRGLI